MEQVVLFCIFYIGLITILSKTNSYRNNSTAILTIPVFMVLFVLAGFRDFSIHNDTIPYVEHFQYVSNSYKLFDYDRFDRFEAGYQIYEVAIHNYISNDPIVFNVISAFIVLSGTFLFFKKYSTNLAPLLVLYFFTLYINQIGVLRQSIALMFFYAAYYLLDKKKYLPAAAMLLFSYSCHHSSILNALLFVCFLFEPTKKKMWLIGVATAIVFSSYSILIFPYINEYSSYIESSAIKGFFNLLGVSASIESIVYFIVIKKLQKESYCLPGDKPMYWLSFFMVVISVLSIRIWIFARFSMYYMPVILIYITNLMSRTNNKLIGRLFMFFVIFYFFVMLYLRPEWMSIYPYSFAI